MLAIGVAPGDGEIRHHVGDPCLHADALAVGETPGVPERAVRAVGVGVFQIRHGVELDVLDRAGGGERDARAQTARTGVADIRCVPGGVGALAQLAGERAVRLALGGEIIRLDLIGEPCVWQCELDEPRGIARELIGVCHKDKALVVKVPVAVAEETGKLILVAIVQTVGGVFRAVADDILELIDGGGEESVVVIREIRERQLPAGADIEGVAAAAGVAVRAAEIRRVVVGDAQQIPGIIADVHLAHKAVGRKARGIAVFRLPGKFFLCRSQIVFLAGNAVFAARFSADGKIRILLMQRFVDRGSGSGRVVSVHGNARLGAGIDEKKRRIVRGIKILVLAPDGNHRHIAVFGRRRLRGRGGSLRRGGHGDRRGFRRRLCRSFRLCAARRERKGKRRAEQQGQAFLFHAHTVIVTPHNA